MTSKNMESHTSGTVIMVNREEIIRVLRESIKELQLIRHELGKILTAIEDLQ